MMPGRAAEDAAAAPETENRVKKVRTTVQLNAEAIFLCEKRKQAHAAAHWALENGKGSRAACASGRFGDVKVVTRNVVEPLLRELKEHGKIADDRDHHHQILSNIERRKLAEWVLACADGQHPKDRTKISAKLREILRARHKRNKQLKWSHGFLRLNETELAAVQSKEPRMASSFFERFYPWCRAHGIAVEEGVERSQDQNRAVKMTNKVVERHFHGEFGLEAELVDAGVMNPITKAISDPRRILNSDETPQPVDAPQKGRRPKVAKRRGKAVRMATATSKESASINMAWDLGGHLYGVQVILKLKELHTQLVTKGPPGAAYFDGTVDLARKQTRACTFSRSADGMQVHARTHARTHTHTCLGVRTCLHSLTCLRVRADAANFYRVSRAARQGDHAAQQRGGGGGRRADSPAGCPLPGQPRVALFSGSAQGRVGPAVAPRHPPLHGGAHDLRLPPITRPIQCHLPPQV